MMYWHGPWSSHHDNAFGHVRAEFWITHIGRKQAGRCEWVEQFYRQRRFDWRRVRERFKMKAKLARGLWNKYDRLSRIKHKLILIISFASI